MNKDRHPKLDHKFKANLSNMVFLQLNFLLRASSRIGSEASRTSAVSESKISISQRSSSRDG